VEERKRQAAARASKEAEKQAREARAVTAYKAESKITKQDARARAEDAADEGAAANGWSEEERKAMVGVYQRQLETGGAVSLPGKVVRAGKSRADIEEAVNAAYAGEETAANQDARAALGFEPRKPKRKGLAVLARSGLKVPQRELTGPQKDAAGVAHIDEADLAAAFEQANPPRADAFRADGTRKGPGFLGTLKRPDGGVMTEYSIGVNFDGKETQIPTLVPGLTPAERDILLRAKPGGPLPRSIVQKAIDHAKKRMAAGLPVFQPGPTDAQLQARNALQSERWRQEERQRGYDEAQARAAEGGRMGPALVHGAGVGLERVVGVAGAAKRGLDTLANLGAGAIEGDPLKNFRLTPEGAQGGVLGDIGGTLGVTAGRVEQPSIGQQVADNLLPHPTSVSGGVARAILQNGADLISDPLTLVGLGALGKQ